MSCAETTGCCEAGTSSGDEAWRRAREQAAGSAAHTSPSVCSHLQVLQGSCTSTMKLLVGDTTVGDRQQVRDRTCRALLTPRLLSSRSREASATSARTCPKQKGLAFVHAASCAVHVQGSRHYAGKPQLFSYKTLNDETSCSGAFHLCQFHLLRCLAVVGLAAPEP